ncbi:MAG: glycoside hydrolase family 3 [Ruminococcus sp.]|nr:glycoside hydrolase family 3 [Ruminococcus sp.]
MKNLRKSIIAVLGACVFLTGCGHIVNNMQDIPVMNEQQNTTQTDTQPSEASTQTSTSAVSRYVAGTAVTTSYVSESQHISVTTTGENSETATTEQSTTGHVVGVTTAKNNRTETKGTTHSVPVNPNVSTKANTAKTTATVPSSATTTIATVITTAFATTTTVTTAPPPETKPDNPQALLEQMTLEEKVYQMFMVKPEQLTGVYPTTASGETTKNALENYPVGGIIYFADNLVSVPQTRDMLSNAQQYAKESGGVGLFTAVDEEGGTVARVAQKLGTTAFSNMEYYGESNDAGTAYNIGYTIGSDLHNLGFNLDFAPVADVNINIYNELGSRIFSSNPYVVANMATSVAVGLQDAGVCATLKHFPGLGAEDGNTHNDSFVIIDRNVDQLRESEFVPFRSGINAGADFVMVSHQIVTGFDDNLPADLSYTAVTEYLRNELGFNGIAITDAQQMNTISTVYSSGDAAVMSVKAGIDIILMPEDLQSAVNAVCNAVNSGEISESRIDESVMRILNQKYELGLFNS